MAIFCLDLVDQHGARLLLSLARQSFQLRVKTKVYFCSSESCASTLVRSPALEQSARTLARPIRTIHSRARQKATSKVFGKSALKTCLQPLGTSYPVDKSENCLFAKLAYSVYFVIVYTGNTLDY